MISSTRADRGLVGACSRSGAALVATSASTAPSAKRRRTRAAARGARRRRAARRPVLDERVAARERALRVVGGQRQRQPLQLARARRGSASAPRPRRLAVQHQGVRRAVPSARSTPRRRALARSSRSSWCSRRRWRATCSAGRAREPARGRGRVERPRGGRGRRRRRRPRQAGAGGAAVDGTAASAACVGVEQHRGDVVDQRAVGVVADRGDHRHPQQRDRAAQRLVAEGEQVGQRAAAAGDDHHVDLGRSAASSRSAAAIRGAAWRSCTGAKAQTSRPAQPRRCSPARTSSRALPSRP